MFKRLKLRELENFVPNVQWTSYIQAALNLNPLGKIESQTKIIASKDMDMLWRLG